MQLKKTKLAGIISLLLCSNAMAVTISVPSIGIPTDDRFGPFVSAMDTSSAATSAATGTVTYTNTYAQPFTYDIGAPWTYNEYCQYDDNVCDMLWEGSESDGSDGLYVWRRNILNTYGNLNGSYESESTTSVVPSATFSDSRKITAISSDGDKVGYGTETTAATKVVRRGFYNSEELVPSDFTDNGGFSSAHDVTQVTLESSQTSANTFDKKLIVGQASVSWANADDSSRFSYCFNNYIDDYRSNYDDLYYCPGFDLQASFWTVNGANVDTVAYLTGKNNWLNTGSHATFIANGYAINTSGFAVGFSTEQVYDSTSGGRARATIFKPTVDAVDSLEYTMVEIDKPLSDGGGYKAIRDTVAIDITDRVYDSTSKTFVSASGTDESQKFIVVGNRTFDVVENRSRVTEFYTYEVANDNNGAVRYPFNADPIKGATSQVSKINNDGLIVGWRDARGETSPREDGSARFQSAFIYDYKTEKSAYLDDMYCASLSSIDDVRYRFANAISISDYNSTDETYTIVANGFDYVNVENYKNRSGSSPVVLTMTITQADLDSLSTTSQCPVKADEDYERSGAGMGWFILLPTMMLLFRRFKR